MTNYSLIKARARDAPTETQPNDVLPPSHSAWIAANGEVGGTDPDYSAVMSHPVSEDALRAAIKSVGKLGATFYRWTRIDLTSGVLDAWITRPQFQGRVGYGQQIEVARNSR